jgi:hypothetical protein
MAWAVSLVWISFTIAPLFYFPSILMNPCNSPPFLVSWLPDCKDSESGGANGPPFSSTLIVGIIDTIVYWYTLEDCLFHACYNQLNFVGCLIQYMWVIDDHEDSRKNRTKIATSDDQSDFHLYNGIFLLNRLVETRCGTRLFVPVWITTGSVQIICMYAALKAGITGQGEDNPFLFLLIVVILIDMIIATLIMSTTGRNVSQTSEDLLTKWTKSARPMDKLRRKRLKAMRLICVRFAGKYIDRDTPIVIQDFCINQTVSLLLKN